MWILEWIVVAGLGACVSLHCKHKVLFFWLKHCYPAALSCDLRLISAAVTIIKKHHVQTQGQLNSSKDFTSPSATTCALHCDSALKYREVCGMQNTSEIVRGIENL